MTVYASFQYEDQQIDVLATDLVCPITHQQVIEPVVASDGYSYSKAAIEPLRVQAIRDNMPFMSQLPVPN